MSPRPPIGRMAFLLGALCLLGSPLIASIDAQAARSAVLIAAERLRAAGDTDGARRMLEARLAEEPADIEVRRLLAQLLYSAHDVRGARDVYATGIARHPDDWSLRLDLGRMLVETGSRREASETLEPLTRIPAARGPAESLLGTLAYWSGDYVTARRRFTGALAADAGQSEARRQLDEIDAASASWMTIGGEMLRDDQPLQRSSAELQAGWYATPLLAVTARVQPARYAPETLGAATVNAAEIGLSHFAPRLRVETELAVGALQRSFGAGSDWTGRAGLGLRLPGHLTARVRATRAPYLFTLASVATPVITETMTGAIVWNHPRGWLAEAAALRERYPDANVVTTAYAWALAPVVRAPRGEVQLGYSFAAQDARETRYVRTASGPPQAQGMPGGPGAPQLPGQGGPSSGVEMGRYDPYFTPERLHSHSLLVAAALRPSPRVELRVGGAYAVQASEEAPEFRQPVGTSTGPTFATRSITPWNVRASLAADVTPRTRVSLTGEHATTSFYAVTTVGLQMAYRFLPRLEPSRP